MAARARTTSARFRHIPRGFWSDSGTIQFNNGAYNYATNRRTDTFAQPGRASGEFCSTSGCLTASAISTYAKADGLIPTTLAAGCKDDRALVALAIFPNTDFRWYRQDIDGVWSYKPGSQLPTNLDSSGVPISNIETANRGSYTTFGGYFCACSSSTEGASNSVIN